MRTTPTGSMEPAIRYRTERRERVVREFSKLESPVVVRFINATDDAKLFAFLEMWGLPSPRPDRYDPRQPHQGIPPNFESLPHIAEGQRIFRRLLKMVGSGDATKATAAVNRLTFSVRPMLENSKGKPRQVLSADNLLNFMQMEIWMVAVSGARFAECEWCGDGFLTGKFTAGRSTAKYCRDKCRVYANRDKQRKAKGGRNVSAKAQVDNRERRGTRNLGR